MKFKEGGIPLLRAWPFLFMLEYIVTKASMGIKNDLKKEKNILRKKKNTLKKPTPLKNS